MRPGNADELQYLLIDLTDGHLDAEQSRRLDEILSGDSEAQDFYDRYQTLHSMLVWSASPRLPKTTKPTDSPYIRPVAGIPIDSAQGLWGLIPQGMPVAYCAATLIVGFGLLIASFIPVSSHFLPQITKETHLSIPSTPSTPISVAQITGMADCVFEGSGARGLGLDKGPRSKVQDSRQKQLQSLIPNPQSLVSLGDAYNLTSGLLEITYHSGAKVILQGPAAYQVDSADGGFLTLGKLTARVDKRGESGDERGEEVVVDHPPSAIRHSPSSNPQSLIPNPLFAVRTPTAVVTDLGTEFGVEVLKDGLTQVHVLEGSVVTQCLDSDAGDQQPEMQREILTAGSAVEVGANGKSLASVAFAPRQFIRKLPPSVPNTAESAYIEAVLADEPMGYWPMNEPAGTRKIRDRSPNGISGYAMYQVTTGLPGPLGKGSRASGFNGGGYIDLGQHSQFAMPNNFTLEAWAWIDDAAESSYIFSALARKETVGSGWGLNVSREMTNQPIMPFFSFVVQQHEKHFDFPLPNGELILKRWLHVALVYDGVNTAHLYLNGELCGSVQGEKPATAGPVWLQIGCAEPIEEDFWHGRLAHVAVYPRTLSQQQIEKHYKQRNIESK